MVSVQISDDLKASVQRDNLALDLLLQNPVSAPTGMKIKKSVNQQQR